MFETAQPIPSGLPLSLSEEIAVVDEEVMELRRQLAEKLRLQNKQLEVLLKRFDAP